VFEEHQRPLPVLERAQHHRSVVEVEENGFWLDQEVLITIKINIVINIHILQIISEIWPT
jgi:hypothetical protein